jgi:CelD/BcsL family acetyltransferase involved in cellulose biosynthesis
VPSCKSTALRLSVLTEFEAVEKLRPEWSALLERSGSNELMLTPAWLLTWWRVYGRDCRPQVGAFYQGERLVGLAPLLERRFWYRPGIPFRRLEALGADVDEGDGVCSDYLNLITEAGAEEKIAAAFARALVTGAFGQWDELILPAMAGDGAMPALVVEAFRHEGLPCEFVQTGVAPYIPLPTSWEAYLKALPGRKRYFVQRTEREFQAWAAGTATFHQATNVTDLAEGRRILMALHQERWQGAGQRGVFASERFRRFHEALMAQMLAEGELDLAWLAVRGEPVAAVYSLIHDNKVYYYQCGRRVDLPPKLRPGLVILFDAIRRAITAGRREFDFLAGAAQYKAQLALASRPLLEFRVARPSVKERLRRWADRGIACIRQAKNALRSGLAKMRPSQTQSKRSTGEAAED